MANNDQDILKNLMADAEVFCAASMRFHGNVVPSIVFHAAKGVGIFTARNLYGEIRNEDFAELARLMCTVHAADAAIFAAEVWCKVGKTGENLDLSTPPSQSNDRQEAVVMQGDSRITT